MCGLSLVIHYHKLSGCQCVVNIEKSDAPRLNLIRNRGPDSFSVNVVNLQDADLLFHASVLHVRGSSVVPQPLCSSLSENILLWNGEIFGGISISDGRNDTLELLNVLDKCNSEQEILGVFCSIHGPWSFVYFQREKRKVWFGRDIVGRRSLLWHKAIETDSDCEIIKISSIGSATEDWNTVPAAGIFCLDLSEKEIDLYPWANSISGNNPKHVSSEIKFSRKESIESPIGKTITDLDLKIDCKNFEFLRLCEEISQESPPEIFSKLLECQLFRQKTEFFLEILNESVLRRINHHSFTCHNCSSRSECKHSVVAILFSGGLDCTVLAVLADKHLPPDIPIDLINVSFEHRLVKNGGGRKCKTQTYEMSFDSPDRLSAVSSYNELKRISPRRQWHLVEVNVTKSELIEWRANHVSALVCPQRTVLDDSIGCALWFAAKGAGKMNDCNGERLAYVSPARVVLLGMGADEQLGGYSRHRNKFHKDGWNGLLEEIQLEVDRISERNLARDDRIVSDSGREARFPYLDENVVSFLNRLPTCLKANFSLPRGLGEKVLLRVAAFTLELTFASLLPKRAIQFGSRIAHLEEKGEKGSGLCSRLQNTSI